MRRNLDSPHDDGMRSAEFFGTERPAVQPRSAQLAALCEQFESLLGNWFRNQYDRFRRGVRLTS
jgi:hypothetical protein